MRSQFDESDIHEFYDRWSSDVHKFCRLYLGDEELALEATTEAFVGYVKHALPLDVDYTPVSLLRFALQSSRSRVRAIAVMQRESERLDEALLQLPCDARAVFVLHGILGVQLPWAAAVVGIPFDMARQAWFEALVTLRALWLASAKAGRRAAPSRLSADALPVIPPVPC